MIATQLPVPLAVRVQLGHAAVQSVVDAVGARALHVKGYALDESLRWPGRVGTDVDVLVHPADVSAVLDGLARAGWRRQTSFETGSAFEHAATWVHEDFGYVDVHRFYPGLGDDPVRAFDAVWAERGSTELGGVACPVPSLDAQVLMVLLHAGRSQPSPRTQRDIAQVWEAADPARQASVRRLVDRLGAHVGFAAAVGGLDDYRDRPDYDLWRVSLRGGTRVEEWRARMRAARTLRARVRLVLRALLVNTDHLAAVLNREPTRAEVIGEFFRRGRRVLAEERAARKTAS
nr:nucleotidyltransferase family protein [Propionibacterium sp.]